MSAVCKMNDIYLVYRSLIVKSKFNDMKPSNYLKISNNYKIMD